MDPAPQAGAGNADDAPEPDVDETAPGQDDQAPAVQKITTKFLTKYERGKLYFFIWLEKPVCRLPGELGVMQMRY